MSSKKTVRKDNVFDSVQGANIERNTFDLSHDKKLTMQMGRLTPVSCIEALPGDTFDLSYVNFLRFAPLIAPVMHRVKCTTDYFFVPARILWDGFESFITGVGTPPVAPFITLGTVSDLDKGSLGDYLGIPPGDYQNNEVRISALQVAAYYKIYDDWYRAQDIIPEKSIPLVPGDNTGDYWGLLNSKPLKRAWERDYFTSALPTTQQGAEVNLPLVVGNDIPVELIDTGHNTSGFVDGNEVDGDVGNVRILGGPVPFARSVVDQSGDPMRYDPRGSLVVDVAADAATINDLREAFSLQAFLERTLRGGQRYIEQMWSHFRTKSSDARLQRPEFLGRSVQNMTISEVLATAQDSGDGIAIGTMAGHGISVGGDNSIRYTCEEHGFIIGIMSVVPETAYQDGINRQFTRFDRFDYAWPSFAHLGERPILQKEILAHDYPAAVDLDAVFGYVPQYSEYRYHPSMVAGDFRDTLNFWTLGRIMDPDNPPALNEEFIECSPSRRIFAVTSEADDNIFGQILNNIKVTRALPRYGVPSVLD